jgi:uncharacterized protein
MMSPLLGGMLIGLGASLLLYWNGRIAGVSGIVAGLVRPTTGDLAWRWAFVLGLLVVGFALHLVQAPHPIETLAQPTWLGAPAGLAVGLGARLSGGCTSGHGVCGVSRLSARSIAATMTFIVFGAATVCFVRQVYGGVQ